MNLKRADYCVGAVVNARSPRRYASEGRAQGLGRTIGSRLKTKPQSAKAKPNCRAFTVAAW